MVTYTHKNFHTKYLCNSLKWLDCEIILLPREMIYGYGILVQHANFVQTIIYNFYIVRAYD